MKFSAKQVRGLTSATLVSLAEARENAHAACIDPIDHRQAEQAARVSFAQAAAAFIAAHEAGWRNPKHRQQWRNTLSTYAEPVIGAVPVAEIDTNMVLRVLQPIWTTKPETASRVRSRIQQVLDYATARGWRAGTNPAIWRGNLKLMLPAKAKVRAAKHHTALDWREMPAFMTQLRARAKALGAWAPGRWNSRC